jgi:hypothetical protein
MSLTAPSTVFINKAESQSNPIHHRLPIGGRSYLRVTNIK